MTVNFEEATVHGDRSKEIVAEKRAENRQVAKVAIGVGLLILSIGIIFAISAKGDVLSKSMKKVVSLGGDKGTKDIFLLTTAGKRSFIAAAVIIVGLTTTAGALGYLRGDKMGIDKVEKDRSLGLIAVGTTPPLAMGAIFLILVCAWTITSIRSGNYGYMDKGLFNFIHAGMALTGVGTIGLSYIGGHFYGAGEKGKKPVEHEMREMSGSQQTQ